MNRYISFLSALAFGFATSSVICTSTANAQSHPLDVGAAYTYVNTNLLPGCNCFGTNGGSGQLQLRLSPHLSLLGDVTATHRGGVTANQYDLSQTIFSGGMRYYPTS